jgi:hypothetical protein
MAYLGQVDRKASNVQVFNVTSSTSATHDIGWTPPSEQTLIVTINGVKQHTNAFSFSGSTLTLGAALVATDELEVVGINDIGNSLTPVDNSVTTSKLGDNSVTLAKMAGGTDGNLITYDASGDPAHVATGTATHVLTSNGAGAAPTFQAATSFDSVALLSSQDASTSASINFDNTLVTSTYKTYELRFFNVVSVDDGINLRVRFSDDNGSTFDSYHTAGYDGGYTGASGAGAGYDTANDVVGQDYMNVTKNSSWDAGDSMGGTIWIQDPTNASFITTYQFLTSNISHDATPYVYQLWGGGMWDNRSAVNYFRFYMSTGNIATGTFQLWGYK